MELYKAVLEHFYDKPPEELNLYGVGISSYRNENEESFEEIRKNLEQNVEVEYHPISLTGKEKEEVTKMDMYDKKSYDENSLLMVPHPSGFFSETGNVAKRYGKFLDLTEDSNLDGVIFIDYEKDLERWRGYTPSKLFREIKKQYDSYVHLLDIEWEEKLLLGTLK